MSHASNDGGRGAPRPRIVLLGASNLTRGISTAVETARRLLGRPLDCYAAFGHGRSLGAHSTVLVRRLPGILECGIWGALEPDPARRTYALLTDIGNDVMYGFEPAQVAGWAETILDRLRALDARIVLTALPLEGILKIGRARFRIVKSIFFPTRRITYAQAMHRARELAERIDELGRRSDVRLVRPHPSWYGFDAIHVRMRRWREAWSAFLSPWNDRTDPPGDAGIGSLRRFLRLRCMAPERRWILGRLRTRRQPAGRLRDGSTIWMY